MRLHDLESIADAVSVTPRYFWNSACEKHKLSYLPLTESPNNVAHMFLKIGEAISLEHERGEGRYIDACYGHEHICGHALNFLFMVLQLWQEFFDLDSADNVHALQDDPLDRLLIEVKMLLSPELDPTEPHWDAFEDVHIPRVVAGNLDKDGKEGIGTLMDVCFHT